MSIALLMPTNEVNLNDYGNLDKLIHAVIFGVSSVLLLRCFKDKESIMSYFLTVLFVSSHGILIEFLQGELNTGRNFDYLDIIANIIGSLIGSTIFYLLRKFIS